MTPAAAIPTVTLNDDHAIPVLGLSVADLPPAETEAAVAAALAAGYRLIDISPATQRGGGRPRHRRLGRPA